MSSLSWLDYSEHDRRRMLEVVDLFKEKDTRDELGLAGIRDAFADRFFPGTSTIMTRARYFLLVPWTYLRLEQKRVTSNRIAEVARRAETDLIGAVERSLDRDGNIGKFARTKLKRLPSSVYWQGLRLWGIRTFPGSLDQYHRSLDHFYEHHSRQHKRGEGRDTDHDDLTSTNWHPQLTVQSIESIGLGPPKDFPSECSLKLRKAEAEYLRERIRTSPACKGSLLSELVTRRMRHDPVEFAWQHPGSVDFPESIRESLLHARNFSEMMHGAALLYNLILAEEAGIEDRREQYRNALKNWAKTLQAREREFREWNRDGFWRIVHETNPRIGPATGGFVDTWRDLIGGGNLQKVPDSRKARELITERESRLKRALARIGNPRAQEIWNGDSGSWALEYRWRISQRLLNDIFDGMEGEDA